MAAHLKTQTQTQTQLTTKPKRRRCRETTISSSASSTTTSASSSFHSQSDSSYHHRKLDPPTVVSSDSSWCCPASKFPPPPPPPPSPPPPSSSQRYSNPNPISISLSPSLIDSPSNLGIRYSPTTAPQVMDSSTTAAVYAADSFPSSFSKFNSALTAGLLNPMSPPPPPSDKARSSPTLFEMMASEPDSIPRSQIAAANANAAAAANANANAAVSVSKSQVLGQDKQALIQQRLSEILGSRSPGSQFNDPNSSDVKLTLSSKDGLTVSMNAHRQILVAHSRFFAVKLSDRWSKQQRTSNPYIVEISDCDDIEVYIEALSLMYCKDLRKKLMKEDVTRVLGILKKDIDVKFPKSYGTSNLPLNYSEMEKRIKEMKWKKERILEDMQREQALFDHEKLIFDLKKHEYVKFLAESSSYATQRQTQAGQDRLNPR